MTKLNLKKRLILVTRPLPEGEVFCRLIDSCNGRFLLAPALEIKPPTDPTPFLSAVKDIHVYNGIIITSANGARALLEKLTPDMKVPPIFSVGKKTAEIIQNAGYNSTTPSQPSGGIELAESIKNWLPGGGRLLFPRAKKGREELVEILTSSGYQIDKVVAYQADPIKTLPKGVITALQNGEVDAIPFFSGRTAKAFLRALPAQGSKWLAKPVIIAISKITQETMEQDPIITINLVAKEATAEGILKSLHSYWQNQNKK
ncbi:MAG: uroporphyrinogen-III synthase [Magnetococcales bacterium]|nr:uroporphyrinogen-III synthase [Magnetococcales bacterium]